jgi:hypothetical protein
MSTDKEIIPVHLLKLKEILSDMVTQHRITESEMIDMLRKAGLARLPNSSSKWIDESGATYTEL